MKPTQKNIQIPRKHLTNKTNTKHTESQGNYHSRVAGPMGRPALLGSRPRGRQYRGVQVPPHCGNRPRWRKNKHRPRQRTTTPKNFDPALSRPLMPSRYQTIREQDKNRHLCIYQPNRKQHNLPDSILFMKLLMGRCPGGADVDGAGSKTPPCKASEIASDFRGPRWASQSQIAKIAAISVR